MSSFSLSPFYRRENCPTEKKEGKTDLIQDPLQTKKRRFGIGTDPIS